MRELAAVLATTLVALAVVWFAVVVRGDTTVAVPSPESVAEQFARHLTARRYDRALQHVDDHSGITLTTVRLGGDALHRRAGSIDQVDGEPGQEGTERATAAAVLTTQSAGRIRYVFQVERRNGLWKIVDWQEGR